MMMTLTCNQCDWVWIPRAAVPVKCPHCQSMQWNSTKVTQEPRKSVTCVRCEGGYTWLTSKKRPITCPKCHSPYWDRPRKAVSPICRYEEDGVQKGFCYIGNCNHQWLMKENGKNTTCPECGGRGLQARKPVVFDIDGGYKIVSAPLREE